MKLIDVGTHAFELSYIKFLEGDGESKEDKDRAKKAYAFALTTGMSEEHLYDIAKELQMRWEEADIGEYGLWLDNDLT